LIKLDLPNIITIALCGALGYGVLVGMTKVWQLANGQAGKS
jgi:hypothetical protein